MIGADGLVGFAVGAYDRSKALVIDPTLTYSTYFGGNNTDVGRGIAVNATGDAYISGNTGSTNFPRTPGAYQGATGGGFDAIVTKLNPDGSALVHSTWPQLLPLELGRNGMSCLAKPRIWRVWM